MKLRVIAAFALVVVLAYVLFFALDSMGSQGSSAFGLVNVVGLTTVVVGVLAAGIIMRRTARP